MPSKIKIEYCCINIRGRIREKNEDNFFADSLFRRSKDLSSDIVSDGIVFPGNKTIFAVYDGMGGESHGEIASYIAASETAFYCSGIMLKKRTLPALCVLLNNKICGFAEANGIELMGTTAAVVQFEKNIINVCNLGDSRIFKIKNSSIFQLSKDHVLLGFQGRKPPLTQFLGIPDKEMQIEPYVTSEEYCYGDRYLICSDGLTDMVSQREICMLVSQTGKNVYNVAHELVTKSLKNGGKDNITVILCEIIKN